MSMTTFISEPIYTVSYVWNALHAKRIAPAQFPTLAAIYDIAIRNRPTATLRYSWNIDIDILTNVLKTNIGEVRYNIDKLNTAIRKSPEAIPEITVIRNTSCYDIVEETLCYLCGITIQEFTSERCMYVPNMPNFTTSIDNGILDDNTELSPEDTIEQQAEYDAMLEAEFQKGYEAGLAQNIAHQLLSNSNEPTGKHTIEHDKHIMQIEHFHATGCSIIFKS